MKDYINENGQDLKIECYYNKGGMNYFTGSVEKRGYYVSVCPVEIVKSDNGILSVSYTAFTGIKKLLFEVNRKSAKSLEKAVTMAKEQERELIDYVMNKKQNS